jgi:hypothetical protein
VMAIELSVAWVTRDFLPCTARLGVQADAD